jgi:hypothetical protein
MFSLRFCANISWWTITPTLCTFSIFLHQIWHEVANILAICRLS